MSKNRPSEIRDWLTFISVVIGVGAGVFVLVQNSQSIDTASRSLQLSIHPTINVIYPGPEKPGSFTIQNTGPFDLINVAIYPVCYSFGTDEKREMLQRDQGAALEYAIVKKLESEKQIPISAKNVIKHCRIPPPTDSSTNTFHALVIVGHRAANSKRFVFVEPFGGWIENDVPIAIPYYAVPTTSSSGGKSITGLVHSLEEIVRIEKVLFREGE